MGGHHEKDEDEEVRGAVFGVTVVADIHGTVCFRVDSSLPVAGGGCAGAAEPRRLMIDGPLLLDP